MNRERLKKETIRDVIKDCSRKRNYLVEYLWIMSVKANEIKGITTMEGGFKRVRFSIQDIHTRLGRDAANEFIIIHNHPNGDPRPSAADYNFLSKLEELDCRTFRLRDFLIFSEQYIYSHEWNKDLTDGEIDPIFWSDAMEGMRALWE